MMTSIKGCLAALCMNPILLQECMNKESRQHSLVPSQVLSSARLLPNQEERGRAKEQPAGDCCRHMQAQCTDHRVQEWPAGGTYRCEPTERVGLSHSPDCIVSGGGSRTSGSPACAHVGSSCASVGSGCAGCASGTCAGGACRADLLSSTWH